MKAASLVVGQRVKVIDGISTGAVGTILRRAETSPLGIPFWRVSLDGIRERNIRDDFPEPLRCGA